MPVTPITSLEEFKRIIANKDQVAVVDFWATWCGPCRIISPIFEQMSDKFGGDKLKFYKVDVDEQDAISQEVGIRAMPTFIAFKDEQKIQDLVGANPGALEAMITKLAL